MIPFLDLKAATDELRDELDAAYRRFMDSGWYVLGDEVESFEREYADYCQAKFCVGVGTGLDALSLALIALNVGPGDEVIVPSNTYIASWLAVTHVGATIVPVEPDERTFNLDPQLIADAITDRTKVIMPVNLYGQPADYGAIQQVIADRPIQIVCDNAQAQGARYNGTPVGGIAHIECHSFYPTKNLGALGEAGAITTNDPDIATRIKSLRNYGSQVRYHNDECGTNSRLDALQAALLRVKLRHLDDWNQRRAIIARKYFELVPESKSIRLPWVPDWAEPVWHLFVVQCDNRDAVREKLTAADIGTLIHYPIPPHLSKAYKHLAFRSGDFPIAERLASSVLSLPMGPQMPVSWVEQISEKL